MFSNFNTYGDLESNGKKKSIEEIQHDLDHLESLMKTMERIGRGDELRGIYEQLKPQLERMLVEALMEEQRKKYYDKQEEKEKPQPEKQEEKEKPQSEKQEDYSDKSYIDLE